MKPYPQTLLINGYELDAFERVNAFEAALAASAYLTDLTDGAFTRPMLNEMRIHMCIRATDLFYWVPGWEIVFFEEETRTQVYLHVTRSGDVGYSSPGDYGDIFGFIENKFSANVIKSASETR